MHAILTRAIMLLTKWRQSLALACNRGVEQARRQMPVIRQHTARYCRLGLESTTRFFYRIIFTVRVLYIRIRDRLGYHLPIILRRLSWFCRLGLAVTARFLYRIIFNITVMYIRAMDGLHYYTPIILGFVRTQIQLAWQAITNFCRLCIRLAVKTSRAIVLAIASACLLSFRFLHGLVHRCGLAIIAGWRWLASRVRHYTPIILHALGHSLKATAQGLHACGRALIRITDMIIRAIARAVTNAFLLTIRFLRGLVHRCGLAIIAGWRWLVSRVRQYTPIILHALGRAVHATAGALTACMRALIRTTDRIIHTMALAVIGVFTILINVCRHLLLAAANILQRTGKIIYRLLLRLRTIAARAGERLYQYALLMRINRPIGIFLLLWPTMWALWIAAEGTPDLPILLIFICGVFLMRSAGCIINDLADRDFDVHVSRTRQRPLAAGKVTIREALAVVTVLVLCALVLVLQLNRLTIGLSVVGIVLAIIYPFTKRYTYMPQIFLGLAFGWAVPMAFAAQTGTVPAMAWILLMATVLWALVYDTMYAMVDREEDIMLGIKSTAILFEDADRFIIGIIQGLVLLTLLLVGSRLDFNRYYYAALAIAGLLFIYQQHLIRDRVPQHCFMAFMNNNWFGAMVFGGILMNYYYQYG